MVRALTRRGMSLGSHFEIFSTGTNAYGGGSPMSNGSWKELKVRGVEPGPHSSQEVTVDLLQRSDLVLTMEAAHSRYLAALDDASVDKVFTLKEIVSIIEAHEDGPWRPGLGSVPLLHGARPRIKPSERHYDIADPIGGTAKVYARCAGEIEDLVERLVTPLWGAPLNQESPSE